MKNKKNKHAVFENKNAIDLGLQKLISLRNILTPIGIDIIGIKNISTQPTNAVFIKRKPDLIKEPLANESAIVQMEVVLSFYSPLPVSEVL